jgi:hypothetical protein
METNYLQVSSVMIQAVKARGGQPIMFLMNRATSNRIADDLASVLKRQMSGAARAWHWLRFRKVAPVLDSLHGIPVMVHPLLPDGNIQLQSANAPHVAFNPEGITGQPIEGVQRAADVVPPEFVHRERVEGVEVAQGDAPPSLDDLSKGSGGRPSCGDVLIKALEGSDNLRGVVVIRVHSDGNVDLCLNVNEFEASGVIQKAHQYLAMRGM